MVRRLYGGLIAAASLAHMGILAMGVLQGWFPLDLRSGLLLSAAFLLAMLALCCSLWALRMGVEPHEHQLGGFFLDCRECGRQRDPELTFCGACGSRATSG